MSLPIRYRDLTLLPFSQEKTLVIACDSSAGIGEKIHDAVTIDPSITSAFCLRVPLLELLCFGATPICIVDLIGNEYEPTGKKILTGIKSEMEKAGLGELPINGSTEENMPTKTTSVGITVIAEVSSDKVLPQVKEDCSLLQLGHPYVANDVVKNLATIFSYDLVRQLRKESAIVDLLPVGSKGIRYEAQLMVQDSGYAVTFLTEEELDCSAGPATVLLAAVKIEETDELLARYPALKKIGEIKRR